MPIETLENIEAPAAADPEIEAMIEAGLHLGHARQKRHPAMAPYIWGLRSNVEIIDLVKTREQLASALVFLRQAARAGRTLLFVGTRPAAKGIVADTASALGYPYVNQRWIGGTLTNFKVISKRLEMLAALEQEKASGGLAKYPRREQMTREDELRRLRHNFDGLRTLNRLPDAVIIANIAHDSTALREALKLGIPIVAVTDTNTDPRLVSYSIPANDDARPALEYIFRRMAEAVRAGQAEATAAASEAIEPASKNSDTKPPA